jgi:two-component system response regulator HydG
MLTNSPFNQKYLTNLLESIRDGIMVMNLDGDVIYFNDAAEEITGYRRDEVIGLPCTVLDTDTCVILTESGRQKCCSLFEDGTPIRDKRCRIRTKSGKTVYLLKNAVMLKNEKGEDIGAVESLTDITSLYLKELELEELKYELRQSYWFMGLLGNSPAMHKLFDKIRNAATSDAPVLICGESGTGKELVANAIHQLSSRKKGPFIKMNCASLNEYLLESELFGHKKGAFTGAICDRKGRFEAADNGSIFLDEIGDMPYSMQVKLLRVLEEKIIERVGEHIPVQVNIRLISATHQDLYDLIAKERFRQDLMYRVNAIIIHTPPLRERTEDIPLLVTHYLKKISITNDKAVRGLSGPALDILKNYTWPGNVRQLVNTLEHATVTCQSEVIEASDLPDYVFGANGSGENGLHTEQEAIRAALVMYKGNRTLAAKHLGISRVTLWKRIKDYNI